MKPPYRRGTASSHYQLILTADGSHTLFVPGLNEHYHSTYGALAESEHIFIRNGLNFLPETLDPVCILEAGFGTGLNAFLTLLEAEKQKRKIIYHSIEAYPLPEEIWRKLNYPGILKPSSVLRLPSLFEAIHTAPWDQEVSITAFFSLHKINTDLLKFPYRRDMSRLFDIIYFDAFGPDVQPELWTEEIFSSLALVLKPGGVLITYSVKGNVKRAMKAAGFSISKLPGPAGKREILRGVISS